MVTIKVDFEELDTADDGSGETLRDGRPFSGIAYERDESGVLRGLAGFRYGGEHGPWRDWFGDGRLHRERFFSQGFRHGPWWAWHENGQLAIDACWECDFCIRWKRWNEAGELMEDYVMTPDELEYPTLVRRRKEEGWPVIDIDVDTFEFTERPSSWGRDGTEQV